MRRLLVATACNRLRAITKRSYVKRDSFSAPAKSILRNHGPRDEPWPCVSLSRENQFMRFRKETVDEKNFTKGRMVDLRKKEEKKRERSE